MKYTILVILLLCVVIGCGNNAEKPVPTPTISPFEPAVLESGEQVYLNNCASCHGVDLKGGIVNNMIVPSHLDDGHTWHHTDEWLLDVIANGGVVPGQMPGFKESLSEDEREAVLQYIQSHWSPHIYARQQSFGK